MDNSDLENSVDIETLIKGLSADEDGLDTFLEEVKNRSIQLTGTQLGVIAQAIEQGYASLSGKQRYVLNDVLRAELRDMSLECPICGRRMQWSELWDTYDDGYCDECRGDAAKWDMPDCW